MGIFENAVRPCSAQIILIYPFRAFGSQLLLLNEFRMAFFPAEWQLFHASKTSLFLLLLETTSFLSFSGATLDRTHCDFETY